MPHMKAASVLPDPVGARMRVWSPATMGGQPCAWAWVGSGKLARNHAPTGAENAASGSGVELAIRASLGSPCDGSARATAPAGGPHLTLSSPIMLGCRSQT